MRLRSAALFLLASLGLAGIARSQGFIDPCLQCGKLYSSDGGGNLWLIDPDAGTSTLVGNHGNTMFDIAASSNGRLIGVDGGGTFWIIDSCDGSIAPAGGFGFMNGLAGDLASLDLFGQGPPLYRVDGTTFGTSVVGGTLGGPPPMWCGSSTGDLAMSPQDGLLYSIVYCPSCGSDMLLQVDPSTGNALQEMGCLTDATTGAPAFSTFGLAFDGQCRLWGASDFSTNLLEIDPTNGTFVPHPITGGWTGTYGFASIACPGSTCGAVADGPCEPLTQGFWKRQCRGHHPSGESEQLPDRVSCVRRTATFASVASEDDICDRLNPDPENDKCEQAEAQFMALLLNVCSGRLALGCCIESPWSSTAHTVGDAVSQIDGLLSNPGRSFRDCVQAQGLADDINTARALCGSTPTTTSLSPRMGGGPAAATLPMRRVRD